MIFTLNAASGNSDKYPPIDNDSIFRMWHNGKFYWAIRIDTLKELIAFMEATGENIILNRDPSILTDGMISYELTIYDDFIE